MYFKKLSGNAVLLKDKDCIKSWGKEGKVFFTFSCSKINSGSYYHPLDHPLPFRALSLPPQMDGYYGFVTMSIVIVVSSRKRTLAWNFLVCIKIARK